MIALSQLGRERRAAHDRSAGQAPGRTADRDYRRSPDSSLARARRRHLDAGVAEEACPLDLAPTASTTAALALGDALAVALLDARGFGAEDFARSHPGGTLGRRLLTHVSDVMRTGEEMPVVRAGAAFADAVLEISKQAHGHDRGGRRRPTRGRHLHRRRPAASLGRGIDCARRRIDAVDDARPAHDPARARSRPRRSS